MSKIDDKISEELLKIDVKAMISSRVNAKIDKILKNKNISHIIDQEIKNRIVQEVNSKL